MSSLSNILKMIILLNSGQVFKIRELAEQLNVSERMIRSYAYDMKEVGFNLKSKAGRTGGYSMEEGEAQRVLSQIKWEKDN